MRSREILHPAATLSEDQLKQLDAWDKQLSRLQREAGLARLRGDGKGAQLLDSKIRVLENNMRRMGAGRR